VEAIFVLPLVILTVLGVAAAGRAGHAATTVAAAAHDAARAASLDRDPAAARTDAERTAHGALGHGNPRCLQTAVAVDTSGFHPGGSVTVRVSCRIRLDDLALPGLPGTLTITRTGRSPLDQYRGVTP